jgi:hypothetical protein
MNSTDLEDLEGLGEQLNLRNLVKETCYIREFVMSHSSHPMARQLVDRGIEEVDEICK